MNKKMVNERNKSVLIKSMSCFISKFDSTVHDRHGYEIVWSLILLTHANKRFSNTRTKEKGSLWVFFLLQSSYMQIYIMRSRLASPLSFIAGYYLQIRSSKSSHHLIKLVKIKNSITINIKSLDHGHTLIVRLCIS